MTNRHVHFSPEIDSQQEAKEQKKLLKTLTQLLYRAARSVPDAVQASETALQLVQDNFAESKLYSTLKAKCILARAFALPAGDERKVLKKQARELDPSPELGSLQCQKFASGKW